MTFQIFSVDIFRLHALKFQDVPSLDDIVLYRIRRLSPEQSQKIFNIPRFGGALS